MLEMASTVFLTLTFDTTQRHLIRLSSHWMFDVDLWVKKRRRAKNICPCTTEGQPNNDEVTKTIYTMCSYKPYGNYHFVISLLPCLSLHLEHMYCSIRRNSVTSSFLETSKSRLGHTKEKIKLTTNKKNNRTGTKSYPSYRPPAQLHTNHHTEAILVGCCPQWGQHDRQRSPQCYCTYIYICVYICIYPQHSLLLAKLIGQTGCLFSFTSAQTTFVRAQFTGRN